MRVLIRFRRLAVATAAVVLGVPLLVAPATAAPAAAPLPRAEQAGCPAPDPARPKRQVRAVWIASVVNIDWPSRPGLPVADQQAELIRWYDEAVRLGLNTAVLQVRPTADAFWPSRFEPWSNWLTGTQGQDPGYDPLAFAVAEAHKRDLELHAWFNPYRISMHADPNRLIPSHPARQHPDWVVGYGGKLYYNPGIPEVRRFVEDAILDAVTRYDIDGVHFDDYFYPYPVAGQTFDDEAAYQRYGAGTFPVKADWRRDNVDLLVRELAERITSAKPWVKFGISPFAVWRNRATDPQGSDTTAGVQTYDDLYADTRKWVREEWIDYLVPQVYWNIGFAPADYAKVVDWWSGELAASGSSTQLFVGQATYKVGVSTQDPAWFDPAEMSRHLTLNRSYPQVRGDVYFSAKDLRANRLGHMDLVTAEHYSRPALIPVMDQLGGHAPARPALVGAGRTADGVELTWLDPGRDAVRYAVYRRDGIGPIDRCDLTDAGHLVAVGRTPPGLRHSFTDHTAVPGRAYTYVVSSLDRLHHESAPSNPHPVR